MTVLMSQKHPLPEFSGVLKVLVAPDLYARSRMYVYRAVHGLGLIKWDMFWLRWLRLSSAKGAKNGSIARDFTTLFPFHPSQKICFSPFNLIKVKCYTLEPSQAHCFNTFPFFALCVYHYSLATNFHAETFEEEFLQVIGSSPLDRVSSVCS